MYQNVKHTWVKSRVIVFCFSLTGGCLDSQGKWSGYGHMRDIYIESVNVTQSQGATMQLDKDYNFMEWKQNIALSKDVSPARKITRKRRTGKKRNESQNKHKLQTHRN